jgi:hypothetical protein
MDKITGKVAAIINNSQMAINRGQNHSVEEGMVFSIKLKLPPIKDPDEPQNVLGSLVYEKARIKISAVFDKMAVGNLLPGSMSSTIDNPIAAILEGDNKLAMIKKEDWRIKVGDEVASITE